MKLHPETLHHQLTVALEKSIAWHEYAKHPKAENAYRSAYFCYQVGFQLDQTIRDLFSSAQLKKRQICFDETHEKVSGEWLLDIVWSEEYKPNDKFKCSFPKNVCCAIECESNTSINKFFEDFAKLVNVISPIKIFLAGLDQTNSKKAESYQQVRLEQAAQYIAASNQTSVDAEWYIGFWPSPKSKGNVSLWDYLDEQNYKHLKEIYLYRYIDNKFVRCVP